VKIAYLTAGAAGMFCGSCMHDNTLARALIARGHEVQLLPLYTPIRTDEEDVTVDRQFFGGINVFLKQKWALFRHLPGWAERALDQRWILNLAMRFGMQTDAHDLGALTVSMLRGAHGHQRQEALRLAEWLGDDFRPEVILLSNILIAGPAPEIKQRLRAPILVTLQGDDIFLRDLPEPYQQQALEEIRRLEPHLDAFLVNSRYYAEEMAAYLGLPLDKFRVQPLGIDTRDFASPPPPAPADRPPTVGYLARLAPEKGLHVLAEAFRLLKEKPGMQEPAYASPAGSARIGGLTRKKRWDGWGKQGWPTPWNMWERSIAPAKCASCNRSTSSPSPRPTASRRDCLCSKRSRRACLMCSPRMGRFPSCTPTSAVACSCRRRIRLRSRRLCTNCCSIATAARRSPSKGAPPCSPGAMRPPWRPRWKRCCSAICAPTERLLEHEDSRFV
jgi:hypothetical protein